MTYNLIGVGNNAKTIKGDGSEYLTAILYMLSFKTVYQGKVHNLCAMADTAKCAEDCLRFAGRGQMQSVHKGRERKTHMYIGDRIRFFDLLHQDLTKFTAYCLKRGITPCFRPDGTTDTGMGLRIAGNHPDVQFYDYTKVVKRAYMDLPSNYHLTLSYSEANPDYAEQVYRACLDTGTNMAVVFRNELPDTFRGLPVINGDNDDLRFLDPQGVVVGLKAKGSAKRNTSGFVIDC